MKVIDKFIGIFWIYLKKLHYFTYLIVGDCFNGEIVFCFISLSDMDVFSVLVIIANIFSSFLQYEKRNTKIMLMSVLTWMFLRATHKLTWYLPGGLCDI